VRAALVLVASRPRENLYTYSNSEPSLLGPSQAGRDGPLSDLMVSAAQRRARRAAAAVVIPTRTAAAYRSLSAPRSARSRSTAGPLGRRNGVPITAGRQADRRSGPAHSATQLESPSLRRCQLDHGLRDLGGPLAGYAPAQRRLGSSPGTQPVGPGADGPRSPRRNGDSAARHFSTPLGLVESESACLSRRTPRAGLFKPARRLV
jgi:hypothetical protein